MKIRLLHDLPIESKHGMTKGKVLDVLWSQRSRDFPRWFVMGDAEEEVGVRSHEAEVLEMKPQQLVLSEPKEEDLL